MAARDTRSDGSGECNDSGGVLAERAARASRAARKHALRCIFADAFVDARPAQLCCVLKKVMPSCSSFSLSRPLSRRVAEGEAA